MNYDIYDLVIDDIVGNVYEEREGIRFQIIEAGYDFLIKYLNKGYPEFYAHMGKDTFFKMDFKQIFIPKPTNKIRVIE